MVREADTVNTSSSVPTPPGKAIMTSLCANIKSLRSERLSHGISTSTYSLTPPRCSTMVGITPMVSPPAVFTAFATRSIKPRLHPPNTNACPCAPIHSPKLSVMERKSGSMSLFAEQNTPIFMSTVNSLNKTTRGDRNVPQRKYLLSRKDNYFYLKIEIIR